MPAAGKPAESVPGGPALPDAVPDELRHAVQSVACLSGILFLLPLSLLVSRPSQFKEACGWAGDSLDSCCALALALLWFSLVTSVAQLVTLSAAGCAKRFTFRLWWHLPATVLSTLVGGAIGMYALSLYLSLLRGHCDIEWQGLHLVLVGAVVAGYLIFIAYACVLRIDSRFALNAISPAPKYEQKPGKDETADVLVSILPQEGASSQDNLKLFNLTPSQRSSRQLSTDSAATTDLPPSKADTPPFCSNNGADSSNGSSNTSKSSGAKLADEAATGAQVHSGSTPRGSGVRISGIQSKGLPEEDEVLIEERDAVNEEFEERPGSPTPQVILVTGPPEGDSSPSNTSPGSSPRCAGTGALRKPALSSFATAKRDGKVSIMVDGKGKKSGSRRASSDRKSKSRRGSHEGGSQSRRGSGQGSRRGSRSRADRARSRVPSKQEEVQTAAVLPATPCDPTEQLEGEISLAMVERRTSLSQMDNPEAGEASKTSPKSGDTLSGSLSNELTEMGLKAHDNEYGNDSPRPERKKKLGGRSRNNLMPEKEEEVFFQRDANPINFDRLTVSQDSDSDSNSDSESDSDCSSDRTEVYNTGGSAKVEVPIWLLEKLKARGWEPPEDDEADASGDDEPSKVKISSPKVKISSPGRFASCPDLPESDEGRRNLSPMMVSASNSAATFWKIPMPTRKNTMMIQTGKGKKDTDLLSDDDDEENDEVRSDTAEPLVTKRATCSDIDRVRGFSNLSVTKSPMDSACSSRRASDVPVGIGGILKNDAAWTAGQDTKPGGAAVKQRKISFVDQELGQSFEKYSEEKKQMRYLGGISEDAEGVEGQVAIKSLMPIWRGQVRGRSKSLSSGQKDRAAEGVSNETDGPRGTRLLPKDGQEAAGETESSDNRGSLSVPECRRSRRPSLLAIFSDDNAKSPGLYAVPKAPTANENATPGDPTPEASSELVEIRRGSLVMSGSMLSDILKSKELFGADRLENIDEGERQTLDQEVILPFFSQAQQHMRNCQCQVDPETGHVVHTCMTPSATQTTNSVFQSYICSEWGTRRNSADKEARFKRKNSTGDSDDSDESEDEDMVPPPPPMAEPRPPNRKRIRNASVLAMVGAKGPQPITKTEVEEEPVEDNELAISFKNIQCVEDSCLTDTGTPTPEKKRPPKDHRGQSTGEARVETELTHKFELLEPYIMAGMLKDPECRDHVLVVDVRGRDWFGGHIPSSINLRTSEVVSHPEALLKQCHQNKITHLVFTCMYSVLRARKCAVAVEKAQQDQAKAGHVDKKDRIRLSLLAGGMHAWVNHFMKSQTSVPPKMYLDAFDPEMWSDGGPSQGGLVHVMDALWSSGGQKALSDALTQELEQLVLMRRNSQELSRRQSSNNSPFTSEGQDREDRIVDENAVEEPSLKVEDSQKSDAEEPACT